MLAKSPESIRKKLELIATVGYFSSYRVNSECVKGRRLRTEPAASPNGGGDNKQNRLETKAMTTSRHCNTGRT